MVGAGLSAEARDQTIGFARSVVDMGVEGIDHHVVALRGRLLVLLRATWSGPRGSVDNLIVLEVDGNSLLLRYDIFDDDALDAALAYLDERFLQGEGAAYADPWRVGIDYLAAVSRHDLSRMEELSAPEMVVHDHRPASFGQLGREEYIGTYPTLWARAPDVRWMLRRDLESAESVLLVDILMFGTHDGGVFESPQYLVGTTRRGEILYIDVFGPDDYEAARACFAERAAAAETPVRLALASLPANEAVRVIKRTMELLLAGKVEEAAERYAPDMVMEDHRPVIGGLRLEGREAFEPTASAIVGWEFDRWSHTVIGVRGLRLALVQAVFGDSNTAVEALLMAEADDQGRYQRLDVFDPDQVDEAFARLDERFLEGEGGGSETWRLFVSAFDAMNTRDVDALRDQIREDFVAIDHRPLGWGELDREEYVGLYPPMFEQSPDVRWRIVADRYLTPQVVVATVAVGGGYGDSGAFDIQFVSVLTLARLEIFPLEDEAAALARAGELAEELDP